MIKQSITEAPKGWRAARVGDILKVRNGYAFKSTDFKPEGVPLIRQSDLREEIVNVDDAKRVDGHFLSELPGFVVRNGDLLIGMSGSLGKIARYQHSEPALQNQRTGLLQIKPEHDAKFARLVLKFVEPQILAEGKGIAVQNVSAKEIEDCTFPLPPLPEQRRIVAEIEKQFSRLEEGVGALRRVQANLKRYRAAVLKAACEGQLVDSDLSAWKRLQISDIGEAVTGNTPPTSDKDNLGKELPFFKPTDLDAGYNVREARQYLSQKGSKLARILPAGSVLVTCIGATIGKTGFARVSCATNQQINALVVNAKLVKPEWAFWAFTSQDGQQQIKNNASATTLPILNKSKFEALVIPIPPLAEQSRIVAEVERRLSVVEEMEAAVEANLQRATRLRQSILQKAFEGKLA